MPPQEEEWSLARRIAQPFLREAVQTWDVFERWYESAREAGISYRRTDMLEDWRREKGLVLYQYEAERLSPTTQPPTRMWTETPWEGLTTSLLYEFRFEGVDVPTRESFSRFVGVGTDTVLTIGEAIQAFMEEYVEAGVDGELEQGKLTLVPLRHKGGSEDAW